MLVLPSFGPDRPGRNRLNNPTRRLIPSYINALERGAHRRAGQNRVTRKDHPRCLDKTLALRSAANHEWRDLQNLNRAQGQSCHALLL
jgi:hypothetical protein